MYRLHGNHGEKKKRRKARLIVTLVVVVVLGVGAWGSWMGVSRMLADQAGGISELSDSDCQTVSTRGPGGAYHEVCETSIKR